MTIRARLMLLLGVIGGVVAIMLGVAYLAFAQMQSASEDIANRRLHLILEINWVMYTMENNSVETMSALQHDPRSVLATMQDHDIGKHFQAIAANKTKIDESVAEMEKNVRSEEGKQALAAFKEARGLYVQEGLLPAVAQLKAGNYEAAEKLVLLKTLPLLETGVAQGHKIADHENEAATQAYETSVAEAHRAEMMLLVCVLVGAGVASALSYIVVIGINQSVGEIRDVMTRMAADGNLNARVKVYGKDGIALAASAFNALIDNFANIIRQVNSNSNAVTSSASTLSAASLQISRGSQAQSEAAASTAAAVEEITVSINSVAANTQDVRKLAEQSLYQTQQGNQNVAAMVDEIKTVQAAVNQIAGSVKEFVDSTRAIASMTQQVKEIADQTNLLALNAAIEAARAGEQGRGFAVVADEVRKLAEKSAQSASEIDQVTNSLNKKSTDVEATVQQGLRSLQSTQDQVARVSSVLTEAGNAVAQSSHGVSDIASSINEQSLASTEIARNVEKIAQMAEENNAAVESNTQEIVHLEALSKELQSAVSRFKV